MVATEAKDKNHSSTTTAEKLSNNPLLTEQTKFLSSLPLTTRQNFFSNQHVSPEQRSTIWSQQAELGEDLVNQYAWATPDDRAFQILKHFSPIVEIGCGCNGYWSRLMLEEYGIDVVAYDAFVEEGGGKIKQDEKNEKIGGKRDRDDTDGKNSDKKSDAAENITKSLFYVRKGGPEVLSSDDIKNSNRTLFLCYPDEEDVPPPIETENSNDVKDDDDDENKKEKMEDNAEENDDNEDNMSENEDDIDTAPPKSLGYQCLQHYTGDTIIHVGELYVDNTLSYDQAPWGRSSSPEFQQRLAAEFHCVLKAELSNWLHVRDTISVWKRSERCSIVFASDEEAEEEEEVEYRHVPVGERLPMDVAAPDFAHLLKR